MGRERNKDSEIDFKFLLETLLDTEKETAELSLPPRLVSSGASLTSCGEGSSLALVGYPSSDDVMIKMPYGGCFTSTSFAPIFSYWVG